jgi:hypothetical protein
MTARIIITMDAWIMADPSGPAVGDGKFAHAEHLRRGPGHNTGEDDEEHDRTISRWVGGRKEM